MRHSKKNDLGLNKIIAMPKADLHCHLDGSVRYETLVDLAKQQKLQLPKHLSFGHNFGSLEKYLEVFSWTCAIMQTKEALRRIASELVEDAFYDGVCHLEIRFSPLLFTQKGMSFEEQIEAVFLGVDDAQKNCPVSVGIILCGLRHFTVEQNIAVVKSAISMRDNGVVGFDIAGPEHGFSLAAHVKCFDLARANDVNITVHAGESEGPEHIKDALFICGAQRIGHGVHLAQDEQLLQYVIDNQIPIECCLSSNVHTGAVADFAQHPVSYYLERGAVVCLSTDNRLISATTLSGEYEIAQIKLEIGEEILSKIAHDSIQAAFTSI